jgi:hypothetical protein
VPDRLREGFYNLFGRLTGIESYESDPSTLRALGHALDIQTFDTTCLRDLIETLEWDEFCDACEALGDILVPLKIYEKYANELNALFTRRYFGYELRDGRIERVGSKAQDAAIAEARGILRDDDLKGPDEQFQKAVAFYSQRPAPDLENAVKEAVSAVEGVAQIVLEDTSLTMSKALSKLKKEKDVHPTLIVMLEKLYAYRGDAEGVGHALTGEKEVRLEDAEFTLAVSASAIVYLARLYGRGVE